MRMPIRIAVTTVMLSLAVPIGAIADDGPPLGNLLSPEDGNLLGERVGNLLGEEEGNLLGEQVDGPWRAVTGVVGSAPDEAVAAVRRVRDIVWPG